MVPGTRGRPAGRRLAARPLWGACALPRRRAALHRRGRDGARVHDADAPVLRDVGTGSRGGAARVPAGARRHGAPSQRDAALDRDPRDRDRDAHRRQRSDRSPPGQLGGRGRRQRETSRVRRVVAALCRSRRLPHAAARLGLARGAVLRAVPEDRAARPVDRADTSRPQRRARLPGALSRRVRPRGVRDRVRVRLGMGARRRLPPAVGAGPAMGDGGVRRRRAGGVPLAGRGVRQGALARAKAGS